MMNANGKKSIWQKILTVALSSINLFSAVGLTASAYAGAINPTEHPTAPVIAMTFPFWLAGILICIIITLFINYKAAICGILGILVSLPAILDFSPLKLPRSTDDTDETFTLMSYNVHGLTVAGGDCPGGVNPTISYILDRDDDIVCLQEFNSLSPNPSLCVTQAQIDSLHTLYPYIYIGSYSQAILSKYPVEPISTGFKYSNTSGAADMACFRVDIKGKKVTIFNVHLQSFSLVSADREMFVKLTKLQGDENDIVQMRNHLIDKIRTAGPLRVRDTEKLIGYIRKFGGPDVIICGDFNDIPGSYPIRMLQHERFKDVYTEVGFGPMITYNSERFYFRIDHILYRGDFHPITMSRGKIKSSDHYPIEATFAISNK